MSRTTKHVGVFFLIEFELQGQLILGKRILANLLLRIALGKTSLALKRVSAEQER